MTFRTIRAVAAAALFLATTGAASAATYTSLGAFQAAATTSNVETFDSYSTGVVGSTTANGISIVPGVDLYIAPANSSFYGVNNPSQNLTSDGNEAFTIKLVSNATFTAFAFDVYTNQYAAPVVSLFTSGGSLIQSYTLGIPTMSTGFFGVTSSTPIGYVTYLATNGNLWDTAIDNVRIGTANAAVPEPSMWAMMLAGFGIVGAALRRRKLALKLA